MPHVNQLSATDARQVLSCLRQFRKGDFTVRLPMDRTGIAGEIAEAFNDAVDYQQQFVEELSRIHVSVGSDGLTSQRVKLAGAAKSWSDGVET